jgi:ankyrin repeat protein
MDKMDVFFNRLHHSLILRLATVMLVALAWSSPAFCGEIHDAAQDGALRKVKALLKDDPDLVFSRDRDGMTPLHWAEQGGHKDMAALLLANHAEVNTKDNKGMTPLHWAEQEGHKDMAELLLANKAEVNAKDKNGWTPLHYAAAYGRKDMAELLRQQGGHE